MAASANSQIQNHLSVRRDFSATGLLPYCGWFLPLRFSGSQGNEKKERDENLRDQNGEEESLHTDQIGIKLIFFFLIFFVSKNLKYKILIFKICFCLLEKILGDDPGR